MVSNSGEQSGKQSCVNLPGSRSVFKLKPKLLYGIHSEQYFSDL